MKSEVPNPVLCSFKNYQRQSVFYKERFIRLIVRETQEHGHSIWSTEVAPQGHKGM